MFITTAPWNGDSVLILMASRGGISGAAASLSGSAIVLPPRSTLSVATPPSGFSPRRKPTPPLSSTD